MTFLVRFQLASDDVEKVFHSSRVDLNVAVAHVVLVSLERQVAARFVGEFHQSFAIPSTLCAQTERDSATVVLFAQLVNYFIC